MDLINKIFLQKHGRNVFYLKNISYLCSRFSRILFIIFEYKERYEKEILSPTKTIQIINYPFS